MDNARRPVHAPRIRQSFEPSPDTTVSSQNIPTQASEQQNLSSEPIIQDPLIRAMPANEEEILARFPHDPMKRYRMGQILKEAMPNVVRKRKYEEILNADEGTESQQEIRLRQIRQEEYRRFIFRNKEKRAARGQSANSSGSSLTSLSESFPRPQPVFVPPRANTQGVRTPVELPQNRRRPLTDSLSSTDSNGAQVGNLSPVSNDTAQPSPDRPPSPDFLNPRQRALRQNPPRDQQVPDVPRSTRSSSRTSNDGSAHSNMAAPSRPTIPYPNHGANPPRIRTSKDITGA